MPQMPVFTADVPVTAPPQPRMDIAAAGEAAQALSRGATELEGELRPWAERYADSQRAMMAKDAMVGANTSIASLAQQQIQRAGTHDANGNIIGAGQAADDFTTAAAQVREQTLAAVTDPLVREQLAGQLDEAMIGHGNNVRVQSFARESAAQDGKLGLQLDQYKHDYAAATDPIMRQQVLAQATTAINTTRDAGFISGEQAAEHLMMFRARADAADAYGDINANPAAAIEKLNNAANYSNMDELTRQRLIARAESKARGGDAVLRGQVESTFNDNLAAIERNGDGSAAPPLSVEQIRAAFPERADAMIAQLHAAGDLYRAVQSTGLTSPQEDAALIAKWQPQGAGFAMQAGAQDALRKALEQKYKQLDADPAAYVLNASPDIKGLFDAAQKDPAQLGHAIGALDAAYDKIGVPDDVRRVLSAPAAQQLATQITAQPAQAPETFRALAAQYGTAWPRAWRDLTTIGGLPAIWQAVPTLDNSRDGALLARWLAEAKTQTAGDLLGAKPENDIKASIRSDPGVMAMINSMSKSGSSAGQTDGVLHAIDALAFAKSYYDRDPAAAQNAIAAFTRKYEFMPNGGARVPADQFDDVTTRAGQMLAGLSADKISVPPQYGRVGGPKPDEFAEWVKAAPAWITAPSADAIWLVDPMGRIVRGMDGKALAVPFQALAAAASAPASAPAPAIVPGL